MLQSHALPTTVSVYGAGYVGLVTAACLAQSGHQVSVLDVDRLKLASLQKGLAPFHEPGLGEILTHNIRSGRLIFDHPDDVNAADDDARFVYIAVGTPSTPNGSADLRYVRSVVERLETAASPGTVVVMKSTVPPGTGAVLATRLAKRSIGYVSNPEFLREGSAIDDWYHTDRIVLGGETADVEAAAALYSDLDVPVVRCDITSAELVKYASNAFLATKISFVNEIAALCDITGADIGVVTAAVGMDHRIGGAFMNAGIGYGGSCFPKDTRALDFLSTVNGYDFHLLKAVIRVNARQRMLPVIALHRLLGTLEGRRVAVLGLTFKPNTDDVREAPAAEVITLLLAEGATVNAHDPIGRTDIKDAGFQQSDSVADAIAGADAVVISTEWPEYQTLDWTRLADLASPDCVVFDGRNCLEPDGVRAAGFRYLGVGRR